MISYHYSPLGWLKISVSKQALNSISFIENQPDCANSQINGITKDLISQLDEYFEGNRTSFSIPLNPKGTSFQQSVWHQLQDIAYGTTISYKQLAKRLGDPGKVRAVGRANGKNPIPIIIPCHRVIGSDDSLTGYSGGIHRKEYLLKHEGAILL